MQIVHNLYYYVETQTTKCISVDINSDLVTSVHQWAFKNFIIVRHIFNHNFTCTDFIFLWMSNVRDYTLCLHLNPRRRPTFNLYQVRDYCE
jgi:uncharacterized Fe-S radical SAM superfamily protein PflX